MPHVTAETALSYPRNYICDLFAEPKNLAHILPALVKSCEKTGNDGKADIVTLEPNLTSSVETLLRPLIGDASRISFRAVRDGNEAIAMERIAGPFKSLNIRLAFEDAAQGGTKIGADIAFDAGGFGVANRLLTKLFNDHMQDLFDEIGSGLKNSIASRKIAPPPSAAP